MKMMLKLAAFLTLLLLCDTSSTDTPNEDLEDDADFWTTTPYPPFPGMLRPMPQNFKGGLDDPEFRKKLEDWVLAYDGYPDVFKEEKIKYDKDKAEAEKRQIDAIRDAKRKRKEDLAREKADTYFKPAEYNGTSPVLFSDVRKWFWALKTHFADRGSKEAQLLSDFFKKYGYIVANIDFPPSTKVVSTISTTPKISVESTTTPKVIATNEPTSNEPTSNETTSNEPMINSTIDTQLPDDKYGMARSDLFIALASLIVILLLLIICLVFSLLVWLIKKCCNKEKESNDESDDHLYPKKQENQTKDSFSVEMPLSNKRIKKSPASKKHQSIVNIPETDFDFVQKNPANPQSNRRSPYIN